MNRKAKIVSALAAGAMVITMTGFGMATANASSIIPAKVFSAVSSASTQTAARKSYLQRGFRFRSGIKGSIEGFLSGAVSSNIITQAESSSISNYLKSYKSERANGKTKKADIYNALVSAKIITQAQADALKSNVEQQQEAKQKSDLTKKLNQYVSNKTITQDQENQILIAVTTWEQNMKAAMDKASAMSKSDRKIYLKSIKATLANPLASLVKAGTITQAQADKLKLIAGFEGKGHMFGGFQRKSSGNSSTSSSSSAASSSSAPAAA